MNTPKIQVSPGVPEANRPNINVMIKHERRKPRKVRSGAGGLSVKNNRDDLVTSKPFLCRISLSRETIICAMG